MHPGGCRLRVRDDGASRPGECHAAGAAVRGQLEGAEPGGGEEADSHERQRHRGRAYQGPELCSPSVSGARVEGNGKERVGGVVCV